MFRGAIMGLAVVALSLPAMGKSVYPLQPPEPDAVVLNQQNFPELHADGVGDDTAVLARAIEQASTRQSLLLLVPQGRYRLSQTIGIPPAVRLMGFGSSRPVFVLGARTPGFDTDAPKYMVWFTGGHPRHGEKLEPHGGSVGTGFTDANPGTFYSGLCNIDFQIQDGNPAAVAIRAHFAQNASVSHVDFHIGSGYAGMDEVGNFSVDLNFLGGEHGIVCTGTSPSWQYTLLDSSFEGQRVSAFKTHNTGLMLIRDRFAKMPTVVSIDPGQGERLWMKDCLLSDISGPAVIIPDEQDVRTQVNLVDVLCQKTATIAAFPQSGKQTAGSGESYRIRQFSYGLQASDQQEQPAIGQTLAVEPSSDMTLVASDICPLPSIDTWLSVRDCGAVGDGKADDTAAFIAAIGKSKAVFVPSGRYRISDTIALQPETAIIGLNPITTQIAIDDGSAKFIGDGRLKAMLDAPPGGTNIIQCIGIDSGANNPRAVGLKWRAGDRSMVNDVKFLGGHGTTLPGGRHLSPYNRDHTGDADPARKWNSCGPSVWITDNGGGTFANIWTASTFAAAGMIVENTKAPGRIYELSSEHHVHNEVIFRHVSNWNIFAQQTEEEWGESPACLPLLVESCSNLTFANTILFRVFAMAQPYPTGISIVNSKEIRFFGIKTYGQSPFNFDRSLVDQTTGFTVPDRQVAMVNITGNAVKAPVKMSALAATGATLETIGQGFYSADHAVTDSAGIAYFVDLHENKVYRYEPEKKQLTVLRDDAIKPFALAVDRSNNLMILSRLGKAFSLSLKDPHGTLVELKPVPAAARSGLTAYLPADRWWDGGMFIETNARREPLDFVSTDGSTFIPIPEDFHTGEQHNWTRQPIDLYRGYQLSPATVGKDFYVADETEHKTWIFTPTDQGTLINPRFFVHRGEAGVATDSAGNVFIAEGVVHVYNARGEAIDQIKTPERPLSLIFCGKDRKTLLITARHAAYAMQMTTAGQSD